MKSRISLRATCLATLTFLFAANLAAQRPLPTPYSAGIQVRVSIGNQRNAGQQIRVDLLTPNGIPMDQRFTDDRGIAEFVVDLSHAPFDFHVRASGKDIEETTSDVIHFDQNMDKGVTRIVFLNVKSTVEPQPQSKSAVTSVAQAQVPKDARNAFRDGLKAWEKKNYQQAADSFEKATALYPQYDEAFNDLGMMYAHLDQPDKSRAAFETAVKLNDKNASADRNLAGLLLRDHNYPAAGDLARKSLAVDPNNAFAWTIAAISDFQAGNPDLAVRACKRAHESPHEGYALCHFVAGQAYERLHDPAAAKLEYETYLKETPDGPEAPQVKKALAHLTATQP
jgi:Tfp pilus assembly protein PilF